MKEKRYPVIIVVVLFSVILWVTVNMGYEYKDTVNVPVVLENIPDGRAPRPPVPSSISFQVKATGWQLASLSFSPDLRYIVDLDGIRNQVTIDVNRELATHLRGPSVLEISDPQPDTIIITLDRYVERVVPVQPDLDIAFRQGYGQVGRIVLEPDRVQIGGAKSLIDKLSGWPTKKVQLTDVRSDQTLVVLLSDTLRSEVTRTEAPIKLHIRVQPFAEKAFLGIPVEVMAVPPNREVILIPPKLDIVARGGVDELTNTTAKSFRAAVDYRVILLDTTGAILPETVGPEGIKIIVRKPERFQYIIRRRL